MSAEVGGMNGIRLVLFESGVHPALVFAYEAAVRADERARYEVILARLQNIAEADEPVEGSPGWTGRDAFLWARESARAGLRALGVPGGTE